MPPLAPVGETTPDAPLGAGTQPWSEQCFDAPVNLLVDPGTAPSTRYVNDIRLGYSTKRGVFLSAPLCEMHGDALCRFVEAHERAHHYTNTVGMRSVCAEAYADCWATIHSDFDAVASALLYFYRRRGNDPDHAPPRERAQTIMQCAGLRTLGMRMTAR